MRVTNKSLERTGDQLRALHAQPGSLPRPTLLAILAAFVGAVIWLIGISLSVVAYNHTNAMPYSCWNHFVSELGFPERSKLTWLFNGTEAVGSLMSLPIIYALGLALRTRLGYVATGFGFATFLVLSGVGMLGLGWDIFPATYVSLAHLRAHNYATLAFFLGWWVTVTLFTMVFGCRWKARGSRPMVLVGIICWLVCFTLLVCLAYALHQVKQTYAGAPHDPMLSAILHSQATPRMINEWVESHRANLSLAAAMEWGLTGSVFLWHFLVVILLAEKRVTFSRIAPTVANSHFVA